MIEILYRAAQFGRCLRKITVRLQGKRRSGCTFRPQPRRDAAQEAHLRDTAGELHSSTRKVVRNREILGTQTREQAEKLLITEALSDRLGLHNDLGGGSFIADVDVLRGHIDQKPRRQRQVVAKSVGDELTRSIESVSYTHLDVYKRQVFKSHTNVGFFYGAYLDDPARLLEGTGKNMRHVKLKPGREPDSDALGNLIHASYLDVKIRLRAE